MVKYRYIKDKTQKKLQVLFSYPRIRTSPVHIRPINAEYWREVEKRLDILLQPSTITRKWGISAEVIKE